MNLLSALRRLAPPLSGLYKSRGSRIMSEMSIPGSGLGFTAAAWTDNRYEQVQHFRAWDYVAIHGKAMKFAQQRPGVYAVRTPDEPGAARRKYLPRSYRAKAMIDLRPHEELEPMGMDHPLNELIERPNPYDPWFTVAYETCMFIELTGSAYWWLPPSNVIGENGQELPAEIWVLPSHWVWPVASRDGGKLIESYDIRPIMSGYRLFNFPADEVVQFRYPHPNSKIDGFAPQTAGNRWIDTSEAVDRSQWSQFMRGSSPGMAVMMDPELSDLKEPDLKRVEARWESKFTGPDNVGRAIFLRGIKDVKPVFTSPREMDYTVSGEHMRDKCFAVYHFSKVLAGYSDMVNRANFDACMVQHAENVMNPFTFMLGAYATLNVAQRYDKRLRIGWMSMTPDDPQQKLAEQSADLAAMAVTPNEIRKDRGREPYAHGGDDPIGSPAQMPIPFNTGEDLTGLEKLIPTPGKQEQPAPGETGANGQSEPAKPGAAKPKRPGSEVKLPPSVLARMGKSLNGNGKHKLAVVHKTKDKEGHEHSSANGQFVSGGNGGTSGGHNGHGAGNASRAAAQDPPLHGYTAQYQQAVREQASKVTPAQTQAVIQTLERSPGAKYRFVNLVNLRAEMAKQGMDRLTLDAVLHRGRLDGTISLNAAEGRHGISEAERAAGIPEEGTLLLHVSWKAAKAAVMKAITTPNAERVLPTRAFRQHHPFDCGSIAVMIVDDLLGTRGDKTEEDYIRILGTTPENGTPPAAIAAHFKDEGFEVVAHDRLEIPALQAHIAAGHPVICVIQDWEDEPGQIPREESGHYVVVKAANERRVLLQDPSMGEPDATEDRDPTEGEAEMSTLEFLGRWEDQESPKRDWVHWACAVIPR